MQGELEASVKSPMEEFENPGFERMQSTFSTPPLVILISALFLISAYNKIFSIDGTMSWMEGFGIPGFLLYPTIAIEIIF